MPRRLYRVPWDAGAARGRLEQFVLERVGDADGVSVLKETEIPKKRARSARPVKQYGGALYKLEAFQVQVGTLLTYAGSRSDDSRVFRDCRLYLPENWY